ncbi:dihydrofolate reductase [Nocardia cyriacigeorgica]|uniref:Dihydrofolate reductase n=3 Tax=Nocardia cyriacigeorgica TaxID=135487 RepID=A0A6P1DAR6_9NOCA|nr:dihydrofolate reductase [Nocardia cyriacigeorgica]NEW41331.1 dihydrofolate reductase [Nocardia cyriacigeorgica]NEW45402.1 dihydrofolate reductase [Nocardia cyriacigeorgica]NEW52853.1 dihydrofolate reductase [Nocardia cyriacigeorgica]NEW57400.1 dihydrofolate reductase [Nocardia cyriacigeorgica]
MSSTRVIGLIWAQTLDGVIGVDNRIPWRVPEDMANFKAVTMDHPVVMGRRTWDSLPPRFRPLTGRRNIVVTRQPDWAADGAERSASLPEALELAAPDDVWVIGGGEIYRAALDYATELLVTEIDADITGDAYAPAIGPQWHAEADTPWQQSSAGPRYRIRRFTRRG